MLVAALVGCGGGGTSNETPPQQPQVLPVILITTGVVWSDASPLSNAVNIASSAAALAQLASGRFVMPQSLASFNYAQGDVVYVEGAGNNDPASVVRLLSVNRVPGNDSLTSELCSSVVPTAGVHRPYALYTVPKLQNVQGLATSFALFPCASVTRLQTTLVASGETLPGACCLNPRPPLLIRSQAELDALAVKLPAGSIPPQFASPNFAVTTLVYIESNGDVDPNLYLRLMGVYANTDGTHDVIAEKCGAQIDFLPLFNHYALYAVSRFDGEARLFRSGAYPPACLTSR